MTNSITRNVRNGLMCESTKTIKSFMDRTRCPITREVCQQMLDDCEKHGVDNHGEVPG